MWWLWVLSFFFPSSFLTVQIYKTIFKENKPTVSRFMKLLLLIMILLLLSNKVRLFCNLMDCSPPGSSVHGISQAGRLEWVAISFSRVSSWPRDWTLVSRIAGRRFNLWVTREAMLKLPIISSRHGSNSKFSVFSCLLTLFTYFSLMSNNHMFHGSFTSSPSFYSL